MKLSIRIKFLVVALLFTVLGSQLIKPTYAQIPDYDVPQIACGASATASCFSLETLFSNVVMIVGTLFGFGFFAMMIYGGIRYLLSGGDPKALQGAKGTITWAIIGLALLALSYTILLIIKAFTGVDVTRFKIGV
ncbi:MAG: hypothetical protein M3Q44_01145 [bacterium]|nr:hypothetical protein [bacterium]